MYENFNAPSTESLDSIFNKLQKIISQMAIPGENISQEDLNMKFLRSLPSEWNTHVVVWRNKADLDTMSIDDLYNNFKIVKQEVKRTVISSSRSGSQNMAFLSSLGSTNEVDTANIQVSTVSTPVSIVSSHDNTANLCDAIVFEVGVSFAEHESKKVLPENWKCRSPKTKKAGQGIKTAQERLNVEDTSSKAMVAIDEAGIFAPPTIDWSNSGLEEFQHPKFTGYGPKDSKSVCVATLNEIKKSPDGAIIEYWVSNSDEDESEEMMNFALIAVLTKSRIVPISTARQSSSRAAAPGDPQDALKDQGYFDSGCFRHMTGNISYLTDFKEHDGGYVAFGGGAKGDKITRKGTIRTGKLDFKDVYFVKELQFNLFSVSQMCDKKNSVFFTDTECFILSPNFKLADESQLLLKVSRKNNMYSFDMKTIVPQKDLTCLYAKAINDESMLWHRRLGHINFKNTNKLVKENLVRGLPSKRLENDQTCVACLKGKQHKVSFKSKFQNSISQSLFMLHMDLFGPTSMSSIMHKKYCLIITDDFSRFTWVFFLATKDETSRILKSFITKIENLVENKVKIIRCDNEIEFKNRVMNEFCKEKVNTACYVQNRVLVVTPHFKTPYELFKDRPPALSFMRPFGCHVTILNTSDQLGKFDGKLDERIFVGYSITSKAFRVYNTRIRKVEENLHITFLENKSMIACGGPEWLFDIDALLKSMNYAPVLAGPSQDYILMPLWKDSSLFDSSLQDSDGHNKDKHGPSQVSKSDNQERPNAESNTKTINIARLVNTATPTYADYPSDPLMPDLEDTRIFDDAYDDRDEGAEADYNNLETVEAMHEELFQFKLLNVWTLVDLPLGKKAIRTKLVYRNKREQSGIIVRNKARLVIRLFLTYVSFMDFIVYQMDVNSAFLYGTIEEEVFVSQPPAFVDPEFSGRVYKVEKALYGLHQAPRAWYQTLSTYLLDNEFKKGKIDKTLFIKQIKNDILLVQVYVDDIIFGSTKRSLSTEFEQLMHNKFQMSSIGELTFFLRLQVEQQKDGIFLSQDKYVCDILKKFGFSSIKSASTLIETHKPLSKDAVGTDVDVHLYRYLKGQPTLGLWYPKDSSLELIAYSDSNYAGASLDIKSTTRGCQFLGLVLKGYFINDGYADLVQHADKKELAISGQTVTGKEFSNPLITEKSDDNIEFHLIVDFLSSCSINYALTVSPTIYAFYIEQFWNTASSKTINSVKQIHAIVDGTAVVISESSVRSDLLFDDEDEGHTSRSREGRIEHTVELTDTVPPRPYDSPLTGGYTPGSDEGRLKLEELMDLCTTLSNRVSTLENELSSTKVVYHKAFITLTKRVKKLETQLKRKRSKAVTHSSDEEEPSVHIEDSPKQWKMIKELEKDEDVNLVSQQGEIQETNEPSKDDDDATLA
nr:hypothetical protein [Tanacetum cinerariifolium]